MLIRINVNIYRKTYNALVMLWFLVWGVHEGVEEKKSIQCNVAIICVAMWYRFINARYQYFITLIANERCKNTNIMKS